MEVTLAAALVVAVAALVGATIQGAIGFGMNLVTVPVLALVAPEVLPVAAILLGVPISLSMVRYERAEVDRVGVAWILLGRLPGTALGAWFVAAVSVGALRTAVGLVVMALVVASVVSPVIGLTRGTQLAAGAVSGVTSTTAGIGGPPVALLYQRHRGPVMRSTMAAIFFVGTVMSLGALAIGGSVTGDALAAGAGLAPVVVLGSVLGRRLHSVLERGWLRPAVLVFSALSAVAVLVDALL